MMQFVSRWTLAGFLVPIVVIVVGELQGGIFRWPHLAMALWPSWMMMGATVGREFSVSGIVIFTISVLVNATLYSAIGALVWIVRRKLSS